MKTEALDSQGCVLGLTRQLSAELDSRTGRLTLGRLSFTPTPLWRAESSQATELATPRTGPGQMITCNEQAPPGGAMGVPWGSSRM